LELAAFAHLVLHLGFDDARIVWSQVRPSCIEIADAERSDIVFDLQRKAASIAGTDEELAEAVRHGRLVRVVPLAEHLHEAVEASRRVATALTDAA
jgi:hypothetical protein